MDAAAAELKALLFRLALYESSERVFREIAVLLFAIEGEFPSAKQIYPKNESDKSGTYRDCVQRVILIPDGIHGKLDHEERLRKSWKSNDQEKL